MNRWTAIGRLTDDPKVTYTQDENHLCIARYTLAVERRGKRDENAQSADFISCVVFGKGAEFAERYLSKGMKIGVEAHIQSGKYTDNDGTTHYTTTAVIDAHYFCESKGGAAPSTNPEDGFVNIPDGIEDELPFN